MSKFDAIVIGGGINGLVAGTLLARRGKSVCIVEQSQNFGGMAAMSLDGGPALAHALYNLSPKVLKDLGIDAGHSVLSSKPVSTVSLRADGRHVVMQDNSVAWLDGKPHPDEAAFASLNSRLAGYGGLLRQLAEAPPPGGKPLMSRAGLKQLMRLAKVGIGLKRMGKPEMRRFLQVLLSNAYDLVLDEVPDGPVAGVLAADAVRGAAAGPRSPGTVFNLIYRLGHSGQTIQPVGGMDALIDLFTEAATKAGCTLKSGAGVTRINIENDAVTGITLASGEGLNAPIVLSNLAPKPTSNLTGIAPFDIEAASRIRNLRARGTAAKVNFKLTGGALPGLPEHLMDARLIVAPSAEYVEQAFNPAKYGAMSKAPVIEAFRTKTPDGATWLSAIVQYAPSDLEGGWTDEAREQLGNVTEKTLNSLLPGLSDMIETRQVISPDMIETATGSPGGHWHHAEMALDQLLTLRPANGMGRYAMGPKGLYLCGASTHPGGDVMGLAGRNAALVVLEEMS